MANSKATGERSKLYIDVVENGGYYVKWNLDYNKAILKKCSLSILDLLLFQEIAMYYDSHSQEPYVSTYKEMADIWGYTKTAVFNSISILQTNNLICKIGKEGRRTKYYSQCSRTAKDIKRISFLSSSVVERKRAYRSSVVERKRDCNFL